jgi:hypothetical protein
MVCDLVPFDSDDDSAVSLNDVMVSETDMTEPFDARLTGIAGRSVQDDPRWILQLAVSDKLSYGRNKAHDL